MTTVHINGFVYYFDRVTRIVYEDRERTKGVPYSYLTQNEKDQLDKELRFPLMLLW